MWLLKVEGWEVTRQAQSNVGTARCYLRLFSNTMTPSEHKSEGNSPINYHLHSHLVLVTTWHGMATTFWHCSWQLSPSWWLMSHLSHTDITYEIKWPSSHIGWNVFPWPEIVRFPVFIISAAALIYDWIGSYWDHLWTPAMEVKFHQEGLWNLRSNSDVTGGHWALSDGSQCLSTETICTSKSHPEDAIPSLPPVNYKRKQRWVLMRIRRKDQVPALLGMKAVMAMMHNSKGVLKNSRHIHFTIIQSHYVPMSC